MYLFSEVKQQLADWTVTLYKYIRIKKNKFMLQNTLLWVTINFIGFIFIAIILYAFIYLCTNILLHGLSCICTCVHALWYTHVHVCLPCSNYNNLWRHTLVPTVYGLVLAKGVDSIEIPRGTIAGAPQQMVALTPSIWPPALYPDPWNTFFVKNIIIYWIFHSGKEKVIL